MHRIELNHKNPQDMSFIGKKLYCACQTKADPLYHQQLRCKKGAAQSERERHQGSIEGH